jgi:hypothetical protein
MITAKLDRITKTEARRRYDSGLFIAVGNERYQDGHVGSALDRNTMGWSFNELVENSTDSRRPSAVFWSKPVYDSAADYRVVRGEWTVTLTQELSCGQKIADTRLLLGVHKRGEQIHRHVVHDGRRFDSVDEVSQYLIDHGLMTLHDPWH